MTTADEQPDPAAPAAAAAAAVPGVDSRAGDAAGVAVAEPRSGSAGPAAASSASPAAVSATLVGPADLAALSLDTAPTPAPEPAPSGSAPSGSAPSGSAPSGPAVPASPAAATPAAAGVDVAEGTVAAKAAAEPAAAEPAAAKPAAARPAASPAHRGAASKPFNDITHRLLKPAVRQFLNHVVLNASHEGWEHIPHGEPLIFAGNHSSWMDGPLVVIESPRTVRCLVKSEMYKGLIGRLLLFVGQIPVDRGRPDRAALHTALDELSRGGAIGVFPEGTRGSGEMTAVQHGIAYLAVHGRCRVVPVACVNTGEALPRGARWPRRSVKVRVVFGEPFAVEVPANPRSRRALAAVAEDIRVRLADHLATVRAGAAAGDVPPAE